MFEITHKNTLRCLIGNNINPEDVKTKEELNEILKKIRREEIRGYLKKTYTKKYKDISANRYALNNLLPRVVD